MNAKHHAPPREPLSRRLGPGDLGDFWAIMPLSGQNLGRGYGSEVELMLERIRCGTASDTMAHIRALREPGLTLCGEVTSGSPSLDAEPCSVCEIKWKRLEKAVKPPKATT